MEQIQKLKHLLFSVKDAERCLVLTSNTYMKLIIQNRILYYLDEIELILNQFEPAPVGLAQ